VPKNGMQKVSVTFCVFPVKRGKRMDVSILKKLQKAEMPYGKYAGTRLIDLPEPYVIWFSKQGFPEGELGELLRLVQEIKLNGLEYLLKEPRG